MARSRKKRYQVLRTVVLGATVLVVLVTLVGSLTEALLIFMLTGIISGTSVVVPVWGVLAIYAGIIGAFAVNFAANRPTHTANEHHKTASQLHTSH